MTVSRVIPFHGIPHLLQTNITDVFVDLIALGTRFGRVAFVLNNDTSVGTDTFFRKSLNRQWDSVDAYFFVCLASRLPLLMLLIDMSPMITLRFSVRIRLARN